MEFLKCPPNSRDLVPIDLGPSLLVILHSVVGQGRVFLRPIQRDIPLTFSVKDPGPSVQVSDTV